MVSSVELKHCDQWLLKGLGGSLNLFQSRLNNSQDTPVELDKLDLLRKCHQELIEIRNLLSKQPNIEIDISSVDTYLIRGLEGLISLIKGRAKSFNAFHPNGLHELDSTINRLPLLVAGASVLNSRLGIKSQ